MARKSLVMLASLLSTLAASGVAALPPIDVPSQRDVLRQWYCSHCFTTYREEAEDCFRFWEGNDEMILRCLNGPREDFLECIALCPFNPAIYGDILALYDDGLLDSWGVVEAIQALQ